MKTFAILVVSIFITLNLNGQSFNEAKKALTKINSLDQIDQLRAQHPKWTISTDLTLESDSSEFPDIVKANVGDILKKQYIPQGPTYLIKILEEREEELCKVKYVFLDGRGTLSKEKIDSLRTVIIDRYNNGDYFGTLVKDYNMDSNQTGELDWFYKGIFVDEFDSAVRKRKQGDLFTVDVDDEKWYYVVLKTHDNKMEKAKIGVMIQY
ncbi:MAG: peptidylprolyl isomerase [Sporocytophaga sp.]|uniref:peptidylprolyl isomerase n=1 Tax=Sporocytophaga sp. TaxID=2231183 RepID=UPI001B17ABBC|nr:peptidylprolyl isomerase [Sporocytophaga sp.]MBO9702710.1 peptidylprolyl isomerase [Sporocytophaga sp.]